MITVIKKTSKNMNIAADIVMNYLRRGKGELALTTLIEEWKLSNHSINTLSRLVEERIQTIEINEIFDDLENQAVGEVGVNQLLADCAQDRLGLIA